MLILGIMFRCLGPPVLAIVALLSSKPLFPSPIDKREEANQARARFNTDNSDILTDVNAYDACLKLRGDGASQGASEAFCEQVRPSAVLPPCPPLPAPGIALHLRLDATALRHDFLGALLALGLVPRGSTGTPTTESDARA